MSKISKDVEKRERIVKRVARELRGRFERALERCEDAVERQKLRDTEASWNTLLEAANRVRAYKLALVGLPSGGAKVVVIGDPRRDKTEALLLALGRAIDKLAGRFIVSTDSTGESVEVAIDTVDRFYLPRCKVAVYALPQQIDKTDDGIERCPKLMRHVCQKFTLQARRFLQAFSPQFLLLFSFGDVPDSGHDQHTVLSLQRT